MPKLPRLTPQKAEKMLFAKGFNLIRSKGSHRVYMKGKDRIIIPFHTGKTLHPKIVKQIMDYTENE